MSSHAVFSQHELILRDELAIDRTVLANERTLLAYLRASLALIIAGISMIHFSHGGWFMYAGAICIPLGVITAIIGTYRYQRMHAKIRAARRAYDAFCSSPHHSSS